MLPHMSNQSDLLRPESVGELSRIVRAPAMAVTQTEVLRDGQQAFPAMLDLIASARGTVCFENFIFAGDATGRKFAAALGDAKRRGVEVRVIYDPVGTMMVKGGSIARAHIASKATATCSTTGPRTKSAVSRQLRPPHACAAQLSLMQSPPTTAASPSTTKVLR